jgi:hypothetical protein
MFFSSRSMGRAASLFATVSLLASSATIFVPETHAQPTPPSNSGGRRPSNKPPAANNNPATGKWKEFRSTSGKFAIAMPKTPEEKPLGDGNSSFSVSTDSDFYMVSYINAGSPQQAIATLPEGPGIMVEAMKGKITSNRKIALGKHPGQEFDFELTSQGRTLQSKGRMFAVGDRIYTLITTNLSGDGNRFFQSFRPL